MAMLVASGLWSQPAQSAETILQCDGIQRAYNPVTKEKTSASLFTRVFKFDEDGKSIFEYLDGKWAVLDQTAEVDETDISARYSRDYPDARIDVIFEFNRKDSYLIYLLDINERPGELFTAHCRASAG